MDRQQILDLYAWTLGICFRHPSKGVVATTHVTTLRPAAGGLQDVRACEDCVVAMEEEQASAARRRGVAHDYGQLATEG